MILMVFLAIVIVLVAYYGDFAGDRLAEENDTATVVAEQLLYYHAAASRACNTTCSAGPINVQAELPAMSRGRGAFNDGRLNSVAFGDYIVSWYRDPLQDSDADRAGEFYSRVAANFRKDRSVMMWAGPYQASTGRVGVNIPLSWKDPETGELVPTADTVVTVTVPAIPDKAPVIVTRK